MSKNITRLLLIGLALCLTAGPALAYAGPVFLPQGSASKPSLSIQGDPNSGLYWIAADNLGITLAGTKAVDFSATTTAITGDLTVSGTVTATGGVVGGTSEGTFADGTASAPGIAFGSDLDNGFYRIGANNVGLSIGGTKRWDFGAATSALTGILTVSGNCTVGGTFDATGNSTVGGTFDVTGIQTNAALLNADGGLAMGTTVFTLTHTTGVVSSVPTTTTGDAWTLDFSTLTTGDGLLIITDDDELDTGNHAFNILGGAGADTTQFNISEGGVVYTLGLVTATGGLSTGTGYAGTGATLSGAGALQMDSNLTVGGTASVTGNVAFSGTATVTGATALNGGLAFDSTILVVTNDTGVISWVPTSTTGDAATFDGTTITSGTILKMIGVDATLNGGYYLELLGGTNATVVWTVGESGATRIEPNVATVPALWLDCVLQSTADSLTIEMDDDIQNGGQFIECLGGSAHNTSVFCVGEDGVTAIASTAVASNSLSITNITATTGDLLTLVADDDALTTGGWYVNMLGASNHATQVFGVALGGATTITPSIATIDAVTLDGTLSTTGDAIQIKLVDATLNGGKYLNCLGGNGTVAVCTIGEDGVTAITSTAATSQSLTITNVAATTGDFIVLVGDDDTLTTGGYYLSCLGATDHATSVFSIAEGGVTTITPTAAAKDVDALYVCGILTDAGDLLCLEADDDVLDGGLFINCLGGAAHNTAQFTIAEGGVVYTLGKVTATGGLDTGTGYTGTGCTITAAGAISCDSNLVVGGTVTVTGAVTLSSNIAVGGTTTCTGALQALVLSTVASTTTDVTFTSAYYGKTVLYSPGGAATPTLPANGAAAGSWFDVIVLTDQSVTISAATVDTLITNGDLQADSVAFSTGDHKIGSHVRFISNGTYWIAINLGDTTMTVAS